MADDNLVVRGFGLGFGGCFGCASAIVLVLVVGILVLRSAALNSPSAPEQTDGVDVAVEKSTAPADSDDDAYCRLAAADVMKAKLAHDVHAEHDSHLAFGAVQGCFVASTAGRRYRVMYEKSCNFFGGIGDPPEGCIKLTSVFDVSADAFLLKAKSGHRARRPGQ